MYTRWQQRMVNKLAIRTGALLAADRQPVQPFFSAYLAVSLVASMAVAGNTWACSCAFDEQAGFIHWRSQASPQADVLQTGISPPHLPANARGVLFLAKPVRDIWGYSPAGGYLVRSVTKPLSSDSFSITEGNNKLKAVVTRINIEEQLGLRSKHYYKFTDANDQDCYRKRYESLSCKTSQQFDQRDWMKSFLAQGKLHDVTNDMERAKGLFRVGPAGGFAQGKSYTIKQLGGSEITVVIDAPLRLSADDRFVLAKEGNPYGTLLSFPKGGSCAMSAPVVAQIVSYRAPPAYEAYRQSLLFFTQRKSPQGKADDEDAGKFMPFSYLSSMCSEVPFGGSLVGLGKELVSGSCKDPQSVQLKGFVGLLEVEDKLHLTSVIDIDFARAQTKSCDGFSFLKDAIERKDMASIRHQVCSIPRERLERKQESGREFLAVLAELARGPDATIRSCSAAAMISMVQRLDSLDVATAKTIVNVINPMLTDPDSATRRGAAVSLYDFVGKVSGRTQDGKLAPGMDMSLFVPLVPGLTNVLIKDGEQMASWTLGMMGSHAQAAVPTLLLALGKSFVASTLVAIAPKDPRVLETLRKAAAKGDEGASMAYAQALKNSDKPAAVAVLMDAIERNSLSALWDLSSMGTDARAAAPLLLKIATTSRISHMRTTAMEALVKIGADDHAVLDVITLNLQFKPDKPKESYEEMTDLRKAAIKTAGMLGPRAQPALPQLMKILDAAPTEAEYSAVIKTLRDIGAPRESIARALHSGAASKSERIRDIATKALKKVEDR